MATLELALKLHRYGEHGRALRVLDLADWLRPGESQVQSLRITLLTKLEQWEAALNLVMEDRTVVDSSLMARICWSLGERDLGDHFFNSPERTVPPTMLWKKVDAKASLTPPHGHKGPNTNHLSNDE